MTAAGESYTVTSKINGMTVKTQPGDSDKIPVIKRLIQEHVGIENLLKAIKGNPTLSGIDLIRLSRLSVAQIRPAEWDEIIRMSEG